MNESNIGGVSIRGILTAVIIVSVCILAFINKDMIETLKYLASTVAGFYFGQKTSNGGNNVKPPI